MVVGIVLSLGFLFLLLRLQAGTIKATFNMLILVCFSVSIGSMRFSWETGAIALVLGVLCIVVRFKYRADIQYTRITVETTIFNDELYGITIFLSLAGIIVELLYCLLFSTIVSEVGLVAARAHPALAYFLTAPCYLSYLWTSQVLVNIVYATAAGVSAVADIETSLAHSGMAPSLEKCVMGKMLIVNALICGMVPGVYFYGIVEHNVHILCICVMSAIQMVVTVGAAAEAAVASTTRSPQHIPEQEPSSAPIHDPSLTPTPECDPPPRIVLIDDQPSSAPIAEFAESSAPIYDPEMSIPPPKDTSLSIIVLPRMNNPAGAQYTGLRSLSVFVLQLMFFLSLTIVAILGLTGVLELKVSNWGNFPRRYMGIGSELGDYVIIMVPGSILENTIDEKPLYRTIITIAGTGLAIHLLYSILFALVVTAYGQPTSNLNAALPYILIVLSYISYVWTSQVLTNTIYASVAALSASHYHPAGSPPKDSACNILKRVCTKSLGSICYASLETFFYMFYLAFKVDRPFSPKYALYNVATYGMEHQTACRDIRTRLGHLRMTRMPESFSKDRLLLGYAVLAGGVSGCYFFLFIFDNVHTICIGILASMQSVFTAAAAVDAAATSVVIAMAHDPAAFARNFPYLFSMMKELDDDDFAIEMQSMSVALDV
ncbi:hypothetical protein BGZ82_004420 [Podila clonocystis]|nr:hypothetical protein BGZ82_004420 [Podila clonocystis]